MAQYLHTFAQLENTMNRFAPTFDLIARIALAALFLLAGLNKISQYEGTQAFMESVGVPGGLLPAVIILEVMGALAIMAGLFTRPAALALAGFSVASALLFHLQLADPTQFAMFFKNIGLAGGFLLLAAHGAGPFSLDAKRASA
jgi:putative oxidoreductase